MADPNGKEGTMKRILGMILLILLSTSAAVWAMQSEPRTDNTKVNQRDRDKAEPTADQQKENKSDRELTRQVRRALVKDKSLSTYAHNIKIIAQNGVVTLKGPVRSDQEKQAVEAKAVEAAGGADKVRSEIEISSKEGNRKPSPSKTSKGVT